MSDSDHLRVQAKHAASALDGFDNTSEDVIVDVVQKLGPQKAAGRGTTVWQV
jgi:hypothetical protein